MGKGSCNRARARYIGQMKIFGHTYTETIIRLLLIVGAIWAIYEQLWDALFVTVLTFTLSFAPQIFQDSYHIKLPVRFTSAIVLFTYFTLFLGEIGDFYERFWWWDTFLHGGAAIGFGLIGFVFVFIQFGGERYSAPPLVIAGIAFCFSVTIGCVWEVFEFGMDQIFGMNMQKSGLIDTMYDLIVDVIGALFGAAAGYFYLKQKWFGGLAGLIDEFVKSNRDLFKKKKD